MILLIFTLFILAMSLLSYFMPQPSYRVNPDGSPRINGENQRPITPRPIIK